MDASILANAASMSFLVNPLDRCSEKRGDADWLKAQFDHSGASFIVSTAAKIAIDVSLTAPQVRLTRNQARALTADFSEPILLGLDEGSLHPVFALSSPLADEAIDELAGFEAVDLRTLALKAELSPADIGALAQARSLIHWHVSHKFCSRCGHPSKMAEAGYRRDCPSCEAQHFPRTDPVVIMLITHGDKVLLGRPPRLMEGVFTTLAGFMEPGETVEAAVRRETYEESRIRVGKVDVVLNQPWPFPANLMLGCRGEALTTEISVEQDELEACRWCDRDEVLQMLYGTHPQGHRVPPPISIAYKLIHDWLREAA